MSHHGRGNSQTRRDVLVGIGPALIASTWLAEVSLPARAQTLSPKELDLRSKIRGDARFVIFSTRSSSLSMDGLNNTNFSLGGHAYVGLGGEDSAKRMSYSEVFGAYPVVDSRGKWSLFLGPIPGDVRTLLEQDITNRLIMKVDDADYVGSQAVVAAWREKGRYQLLWEDCTTMMGDIARKLGLRVPDRGGTTPATWFPSGFLGKLIDVNPQSAYLDGSWDSTDGIGRWRLVIRRNACTWTERNAAGASLTRDVKLVQVASGYRIERPNDAEVLAFAGARPSIVSAILARGPAPSFMTLYRPSTASLQATWSGIKWTLDAQNRLTNVIQPGASSLPVAFTPAFGA